MAETYRVFWQPGCSSCLKAKEFLTSHHIEYDPVNVLADDAGMAALEALGASSVPVVSKGEQFVFAQSLSDLAKFIGVVRPGVILPVNELVARIDRVMAVAQSHVCQLCRCFRCCTCMRPTAPKTAAADECVSVMSQES